MKIYTKGGDEGQTSLVSGKRVSKADLLIESYGTVDELNATVGVLMAENVGTTILKDLLWIQNKLFNVGSVLAKDGFDMEGYPKLYASDTEYLELRIDTLQAALPMLNNFILPSGSKAIAQAHICRTVCRRAERRVVAIESCDSWALMVKFLNRLSDYFFVASRYIGYIQNQPEIHWNPNLTN